MDKSLELLCSEIKKEAQKEIDSILSEAKERFLQRLNNGKEESEQIYKQIISKAQVEAELSEKKILSEVTFQIKKIELEAKEEIINEALKCVDKKKKIFSASKRYAEVLKQFIIEGVLNLEESQVKITVNNADKKIVDKKFVSAVEKELDKKYSFKTKINLNTKETIDDLGVIVKSQNERIVFDNTFNTRMKRLDNSIRGIIALKLF
jgi:V/A-type H+-transporting ATPase subunit E